MWTIRPEQAESMEQAARAAFIDELVEHSKDFSPKLSAVLGDEQLRLAVTQGYERAEQQGFGLRGPVRTFIELQFLFGSSFDTDPQYPWVARCLKSSETEMRKAEDLVEQTLRYQENVSGREAANTRQALKSLLTLSEDAPPFTARGFEDEMLAEMKRIFPQKAKYLGDGPLKALIQQGREDAKGFRMPGERPAALLTALKFAFGHGCTNDPLYPWIHRTLTDVKIVDGEARADRLERKSITWLQHVVEGFEGEAPA